MWYFNEGFYGRLFRSMKRLMSPWPSLRKKLHIFIMGQLMQINVNVMWEGEKWWHVVYGHVIFGKECVRITRGGVEKCRKDFDMLVYRS